MVIAGNPNPVLQKEVSRLGKEEKEKLLMDAGITVQISPEEGIAMKALLGIPWSKNTNTPKVTYLHRCLSILYVA